MNKFKVKLFVSIHIFRTMLQVKSSFKTRYITIKFKKVVFHIRSLKNTINNFINVDEELMIPRWLFDERKTVVINLPFSNKNEHFPKTFCEKLESYTSGKVKFNIIWATR